ncbi:MAG TPA: hypothetical protein VE621_03360, partial [Bryobacteraceae bacterium]|nr:hypothetical protein [Bryobacteraceae bacterium]
YHLEPNIKDGPGGVRDFHLLRWLDTLRNNPHPLDPSLTEAWRFLAAVRSELHFSTNRDSNQLTFELQEALSPQTAAWMRDLFRHLRTIHRATLRSLEAAEEVAAGGLLQQFRDWRSRVSNAEFTVGRERILFRSPQALAQDPQLLFRLFEFVAHHGLPLAPDTEKRVAEHLPKLRRWLTDEPPLWPTLRTIFKEPHAALAIRAMHETGVLDTIFPELSLIDCLVIRDFYHRYTVDEHTFVAIEKLLALRDQKDDKRSGFADLFSETDAIDLIILALLFHDSGKGAPTTDHSRESSRLAQRAFARIKLPEDASQRCLFLIEQHLILSELMTSRDLSDPDTVATASRKVGTIERLRDLTLLTFADSSAVNPDSMTSWRASQLWRLYLVTHGELTHELDMDRIAATTDPNLEAFLDGFPTRYTLTHNEVEIRSHAQLEAKARHTGAAVEIRRTNGFYEAAIVTSDRPRLFAALAGTLSAFGLNIRRAEAFANNRGIVLDTFVFEDPLRNLELNPSEVDRLKEMLLKSAQGKHDFEKILRNRKPKPRPSSSSRIRPIVSVRPGRSGNSLIEIVAEDRPGLLYDLASAIAESNCSIDTVLIHTEAHKAIDVFYISQQNGPIPEPVSVDLKARLLDICTAPR